MRASYRLRFARHRLVRPGRPGSARPVPYLRRLPTRSDRAILAEVERLLSTGEQGPVDRWGGLMAVSAAHTLRYLRRQAAPRGPEEAA